MSSIRIRKLSALLLLVAGFVMMHGSISAGETEGSSGYEFLRTDLGARPSALAGAFVSVRADLHGIHYNPASIAGVGDLETSFTFLDHFMDIKSGFVAVSKTFPGLGQLALGIAYINYGTIDKTDMVGEVIGSFTPGDVVVSVTYANSLGQTIHYGLTVKTIQSRIDVYTSNAIAADLGLIYRTPMEGLDLGLAALNLGATTKAFLDVRENLPTSFRLGGSKRLAHLPFLFNFNLIKFLHNESDLFWGLYWALGGEFTVTENLFLRGGYNSRGNEERFMTGGGRFAGVSLGLGLRFSKYRIDYAFCSYGSIGSMNNFTVSLDL